MDLRVCLVVVIVLASWPAVPASAAPVETTSACIPVRTNAPLPPLSAVADVREHAPILIWGDEMLRLGRAAGVCGGTGTAEDPYRIERWYIDSVNWTLNGVRPFDAAIEIRSTTAHVLIRNVTIVHAPAAGILIRDARNVRVEDVFVNDASWTGFEPTVGVKVLGSTNVQVTGSRIFNERSGARDFTGISVEGSASVTVRGNRLEQVRPPPTRFFGIHAGNSTGTQIVENQVLAAAGAPGRWYAFHVNDEVSPAILRNVAVGPSTLRGTCLSLLRAATPTVADNTLSRCANGVQLLQGNGGSLLRNGIHNVTRGVLVDGSTGVSMTTNRIVDATRAFNVTGTTPAHFQHTVAIDNTVAGAPILYLSNVQNTVVDASAAAVVFVVGARNVTVSGAAPRGQAVGVTVVDSARTTLRDLDLRANDLGIRVLGGNGLRFDRIQTSSVRVQGSDGVVLSNLTVRGGYTGVDVSATDASRIEHSLIEGNVVGIRISGGNTVTVASSLVRNNTVGGIHLVRPDYVRVEGNDIRSNPVYGVRHDGITSGGSRSDLRGNWWGHVGGPTLPGTPAGDRLVVGNNAIVAHQPWLTAPAAGAGPATP